MKFFWCCFCVYVLRLAVSASESDSWTIDVPASVVGLEGSCVVIPCQFSYPGQERKSSHHTGIWFTDSEENVYHSMSSQISTHFKHRTSLLDDLKHKNCSLRINPLKHTDTGPFTFRIEIENFNKYSYKHNQVSITVKDSPENPTVSVAEPVKSGKKVTSTCSVLHSCPSDLPDFTWSHQGQVISLSSQQSKDQWKVTSSLSFTPTKMDHNTDLRCTVVFPGGKKVTNMKTLNVAYPPVSVAVISKPSVLEGDTVDLNCSSDSNPAANVYKWFSQNGTLLSEGHTYILKHVGRHTEPLYCTASNTEGQANSRPVQLNITYPPQIKVGSSCTSEISTVTCLCMVDSNPTSYIKWWGSDPSIVLHSTSTERHGCLTIATLQGALDSSTMYCHASNSLGNSTMALHVPHSGKVAIGIAVSAFLVIFIVFIIWMVKRSCVNSRTEQPMTHTKTEMNATTQSDSKRKSEAYSAYDESQHVYGNMGLEEDYEPTSCDVTNHDEIYANV